MKIATWNIERLKHIKKIAQIIEACENVNADILILTEYDERVDLKKYPFQIPVRAELHSVPTPISNGKEINTILPVREELHSVPTPISNGKEINTISPVRADLQTMRSPISN